MWSSKSNRTRTGITLLGALCLAACGGGSSGGATPAAGAGAGGATGAGGNQGLGGASTNTLGLKVTVDATTTHPISPLIYGVVGTDHAAASKARLVRLGGNRLTAYNWENNATNGGKTYGFSNSLLSDASTTGAAVSGVLSAATANGGTAVVTVPIGDYVAADGTAGDVRTTAGFLTSRFRKNKPTKPGALSPTPDTSDDSVYQDEFVAWAKGAAGATPTVFTLDNQPELWSEDHAEIHPMATLYDEVVTRNVTYAKRIKALWPGAPVTGYSSYGWQGYANLQNSPDAAKGEFIAYYLDKMKAAEADAGGRLLDYLDIHWYPEAQGGGVRIIGPESTPEIAAARVQAPRSLWDTTYQEQSWIEDVVRTTGESIALIPRMRGRIDQHYPGTKLAISAWYYGGGGDISGALATADVLGIFGREGVDLAAVDLSDSVDDKYTIAAFRAYLDYDGKGKHFGDTGFATTTDDAMGASAYASTDAGSNRVVVVVVNKRPQPRALRIDVGGTHANALLFTLAAGNDNLMETPGATVADGAITATLAASSVSVVVVE